jgi:Fe-S-cluster containining protein
MKPWYLEGVHFKCTGCGNCCAKEPGAVFISMDEIEQLASFLGMEKKDFLEKYTRKLHGKISLKEHPNFDCVFLKENRCTVYHHRPKQCKTYPFWPELMRSKKGWDSEKIRCEGLDHPEGVFHSFEEIRKKMEEAN